MWLTVSVLAITWAGLYVCEKYSENKKKNKKSENGKERLKSFQFDAVAPLFANPRQQQLKEFSGGEEAEVSEFEKEINRCIVVSSVSLGLVTAGAFFYPPLTLFALPGLVYSTWPFLREGYKSIVKDLKFSIYVLDSIAFPAMLLTGYFWLTSLAYTF